MQPNISDIRQFIVTAFLNNQTNMNAFVLTVQEELQKPNFNPIVEHLYKHLFHNNVTLNLPLDSYESLIQNIINSVEQIALIMHNKNKQVEDFITEICSVPNQVCFTDFLAALEEKQNALSQQQV